MQSTSLKNRRELKKKLLWGDVAKIAKLAEVSRSTVDRWFNGKNDNTVVATFAAAVIEKRKEKVESIMASL